MRGNTPDDETARSTLSPPAATGSSFANDERRSAFD